MASEREESVDCRRRANEMTQPSIAAEIMPCPTSSAPSRRSRRMPHPNPTPNRMPPMMMDMVAAVMARSKLEEDADKSIDGCISLFVRCEFHHKRAAYCGKQGVKANGHHKNNHHHQSRGQRRA